MAYNFPYKSYPESGDTYDYLRQAEGRGRVVVNPKGSKLEQVVLTRAVNQTKLLKQIKELESMTACAGIRNNISAAYKARVNHYGGVSSWGMLLPIRRWVDSAYSDTQVTFTEGVEKNFQGKNSKAIADYLAKAMVTRPKLIPGIKKLVTYDEFADDYPSQFESMRRSIKKETGEHKYIYSMLDTWQEQSEKVKFNKTVNKGWDEGVKKRSVMTITQPNGDVEYYFIAIDKKDKEAGLFGAVGKGKPYMATPRTFMKGLAAKMAANQRRAIRNMTPPNTPVTEAIKGKNSPLIWTGAMLASIESWVDE